MCCKTSLFTGFSKSFWYTLPARLVLGVPLAIHGYMKIAPGIDGFAEILGQTGFPIPMFFAWAAALIELVGGIFLVLGVLYPFVLGLFISLFVVINYLQIFVWKTALIMTPTAPGYEYSLVLLGVFVTLLLMYCKENCGGERGMSDGECCR